MTGSQFFVKSALRKRFKMMTLQYLYKMDPKDERAETIMKSDDLCCMRKEIEEFWQKMGFNIYYYRMIDLGKDGIIIDFGHHTRFYNIVGFTGTMNDFLEQWYLEENH